MLTHASNRLDNTDNNPNSIDKSLGNRVKAKRLLAGLSQGQLAEKLCVDLEDVVSYESGTKRVGAAHLLELSKALGVTPLYFFASSDEREGAAVEAEKRPPARAATSLALHDQGVRLNRAFVGVRSSALREAIIRLVTEMGRGEDAR